MKLALLILISVLSTNAFAGIPDFPEYLLGKWEEASRNPESEKLEIQGKAFGDFTIVKDMSRQVGSEDSATVPYPTECRFRHTGIITEFKEVSEDRKAHYRQHGKEPPTHMLVYAVSKIELLPAFFNSPNCSKYIQEKQNSIVDGGLSYYDEFKDLNDSAFMDTWQNKVFVKTSRF